MFIVKILQSPVFYKSNNRGSSVTVAERIKYYAKKRHGGVSTFAEAIGITQQSLSTYTTGRSEPGMGMLRRFYDAGMSIDWLIGGGDDDEMTRRTEKELAPSVIELLGLVQKDIHALDGTINTLMRIADNAKTAK